MSAITAEITPLAAAPPASRQRLIERFAGVESNQLVTVKEGQGIVRAPLAGAKVQLQSGSSNAQK